MPFVGFLVSKRYTYIISIILLLSEIIPLYSHCTKKKLVYIIVVAPFSCQPSFYIKYIKINMHLSYNIKLVSNIKYL